MLPSPTPEPKVTHEDFTPSAPPVRGSALREMRQPPEASRDSLLSRFLRSEANQELLERYVPDAVREQIERGRALDRGEREVTVLFSDVHGFTSIAESLGPEQIHQLLSSYIRSVSRQVQRHGGAVVDFSGDGMMAVFGALEDDDDKERAAVATARSIVHEVRRFRDPTGRRLPVGVGVATGAAWVGNIETADRLIWSAVGNATNLASRLQKLAHELSTPVILDATTRRRAGAQAGGFLCRPDTRIRGRDQPQEIWMLPLERGEC